MRMWGGWKGLPLAASHWPGMTTFSPEAASSFLLLSVHITPPSICVHLPLLLNSRHPHHNRSVSYSLAFWTRRRHCFGVFFFLFFPSFLPPLDAYLELPLFLRSCSLSSLPPTSLPQPAPFLCWLAVFLQHATSVHHPDLCNGATPASY